MIFAQFLKCILAIFGFRFSTKIAKTDPTPENLAPQKIWGRKSPAVGPGPSSENLPVRKSASVFPYPIRKFGIEIRPLPGLPGDQILEDFCRFGTGAAAGIFVCMTAHIWCYNIFSGTGNVSYNKRCLYMSIDNTQWADYDNRKTFDFILQQLRPWGYTDESWGNDACPKITLLGDAMKASNDINLFVGWKDPEMNAAHLSDDDQFALSMDCNFQRALGCEPFRCFYKGNSVEQLIKVAKQIAPAQETYNELIQQGYEINYTGGGCYEWAKEFGDYCVTVTGDGYAHFISMVDDEESVSVDEVLSIGITENGSHYWGAGNDNAEDGSDIHSWVRVGDRKGLAASLEVAETIAYEASMEGVDLLADLSKFYDLMLSKHCPGKKKMSADEFLMEYRDQMTTDQTKLISSFIRFWEDLQNMEVRS